MDPEQEKKLPTVLKYKQETPSPQTVSKIKSWEAKRHGGEIPKGSAASEIESKAAKEGIQPARAHRPEKKGFKRSLIEEEENMGFY
ncbi:hypothetical protein P9112_010186 [Eukaryota sp. TZLM1-RC]